MPLVVFVVGAPGAGKSTVVRRLAEHPRCVEFLRGDVLRRTAEEDTEIGRAVADRLSRDETMPVALYCRIVRREVGWGGAQAPSSTGFPNAGAVPGHPRLARRRRDAGRGRHRLGSARAGRGVDRPDPPPQRARR
ncbi:nucleoside monophosphate kinase [Saccharothrix sp. 6-C]|nr:nucleoside monophosphate kinase [Saccharothrix sp. 6-C]